MTVPFFEGTFSEYLKSIPPVDLKATFPFAHIVPRFKWVGTYNEFEQPDEGNWDWADNDRFREWINRRGEHDKADRRLIFDVCEQDPLFFINAFLWIKQESPIPADLPFVTWPKQDE